MKRTIGTIALATLIIILYSWTSRCAWAWDSKNLLNRKPTHTYLTEYAINKLKKKYPELNRYRSKLIEGANKELHELSVKDPHLNRLRVKYGGTNAGCKHPEGWWKEAVNAYKQNKRAEAYVYLGILLHMIQDMGVPSHAWDIYHQTSFKEPLSFDNFEYMALFNWKPTFKSINRKDPKYSLPWKYYKFSRDWTRKDTRNWHGNGKPWNKSDRDDFSKTWTLANEKEEILLRNRQGRTSVVTKWTLASAMRAFGAAKK